MKQAKEHTKRLKQLFQSLSRKYGKPDIEEPADPLHQLLEGILAECTTLGKARTALQKILAEMVDLNELRVTPPRELEELLDGAVPLGQSKAQQIIEALNDIRKRQEDLDLGFLKDRGRREARDYLESLAGVGRSVAARVVLFSLGGHAIPVDDLTLYILRKDDVVDEAATAEEAQGFLERHVSAADSRAFAVLLDKHVAAKSSRVDVSKLDELLNPPPPPPPEPAPEKKRRKTKSAAADTDGESSGRRKSSGRKKAANKPAGKRSAAKRSTPKKKTSARKSTTTKKARKKSVKK